MFAKAKGPIDTQEIIDRLTDCPDIDKKKVFIGGKYEAYFIYITGQIDKDIIQRDFISNIVKAASWCPAVDVVNCPYIDGTSVQT